MPDIQEVMTACKALESLLEKRFHAQGRGLHEKIDSVRAQLSPLQIRGLRSVATVRNKIVHEDRFTSEHVPEDYLAVCQELSGQLDGSIRSELRKPISQDRYAAYYCACLQQERFVPEIDRNGDVTFKDEGETYRINIQQDDPEFLRLLRPEFHRIRRLYGARRAALEAANFHTLKYKAAKFYVSSKGPFGVSVDASIEMFLETPEHFRPVCLRCVRTLKAAVKSFRELV